MQWKDKFMPHILERGYNYYNQGQVENFYASNDLIEAAVLGSEYYDVDIDLEDKKIIKMFCSCPHAADGNNCKHMAAVLFEYDKIVLNIIDENYDTTSFHATHTLPPLEINLERFIDEADIKFLKEFLLEVLSSNKNLSKRFEGNFICDIRPYNIIFLKNEIRNIFYYNSDSGFVDYDNADDFFDKINNFIDKYIEDMLMKHQFKDAFTVSSFLSNKMDFVEIDDVYDRVDSFNSQMINIWHNIYNNSDDHLKQIMFTWFIKELKNDNSINTLKDTESFLFSNFKEENFMLEKLKAVLVLKERSDRIDTYNLYNYRRDKWAIKYLELLEELEVDQVFIDDYIENNLNNRTIRQKLIDKSINNKDYKRAITVLKEGKVLNGANLRFVLDYSLQLKDLYLVVNDTNAYANELGLLLIEYIPGDLDTFIELKKLYSKQQWETVREQIFKKLENSDKLGRLYVEEKLYARLLSIIINSESLNILSTFEEYLIPLYSKELLDLYECLLEKKAIPTLGRSQYQGIIFYLRKMKKYPNGDERVEKLVSNWRVKYKVRRAMMEELDKV